MKRAVICVLVLSIGLGMADSASAATKKRTTKKTTTKQTVVVKDGRKTVVVYRGWPLRRPLHTVVIRRPGTVVRVTPARYLPLMLWTPELLAGGPPSEGLVWQDSEPLAREDDWTEVTLQADNVGRSLDLQVIDAPAQLDFAEVVFDNGETRVVDMGEKTRDPGYYKLLTWDEERRVDHVRVVGRTRTTGTKIALLLEK